MDDFLDLSYELLEAGSSASRELWDRFAEAVDQQQRWRDGAIAAEEARMCDEYRPIMVTIPADAISTAVNGAYAAGRSDQGPGGTAACQ